MILYTIISLLLILILGAYLTNPFSRLTVIRRTYSIKIYDDAVKTINNNYRLKIRQSPPYKIFAVLKNGVHILESRWLKSPTSKNSTVETIVNDIYALRFNPKKLLLTSGDHFSALFVRNLGVFYYPSLDTHISADETVWQNRQSTYIQTLAYALGVFDKHDTLTTTIVPTGRHVATCVNFYAYPSDTLYGMLYGLAHVLGIETGRPYDYDTSRINQLDILAAATELHQTYQKSLTSHYTRYRQKVYDEKRGLIDPRIRMSGAKDITKRSSAFYDNVIFWKTTQLAQILGLIDENQTFLDELKTRIISTYWLEDEGYFLEDLSMEGQQEKYYSSDWLIVLATGFLNPAHSDEAIYFTRSIDYIHEMEIDRPFAIKYQHETRAHRQFAAVRLAVASYGGDSIWSFWGMEYIKTLIALYRTTDKKWYLKEADYHIKKYEAAIIEYGGFPEVYDTHGIMLQTPLYRSIRQTGWVIGFDQVCRIRESIA
ncbi:MAG: hypothetical protein ACSLEY_00820 [Candidatus Saccharimonadales bacterium]